MRMQAREARNIPITEITELVAESGKARTEAGDRPDLLNRSSALSGTPPRCTNDLCRDAVERESNANPLTYVVWWAVAANCTGAGLASCKMQVLRPERL